MAGERKLSKAEQRRHEVFEATTAKLAEEGYKRVDLTISILKANLLAVGLLLISVFAGVILLILVNAGRIPSISRLDFPVLLILFVVLIVVHELIHGVTWSFFAQNGMKDIEFGFMLTSFTPYCTCKVPLPKNGYILGGLMPLIVLGIIPFVISVFAGSFAFTVLSAVMISSAAGDIMIVSAINKYRSDAKEKLIYDHPTEAGCVIFEK